MSEGALRPLRKGERLTLQKLDPPDPSVDANFARMEELMQKLLTQHEQRREDLIRLSAQVASMHSKLNDHTAEFTAVKQGLQTTQGEVEKAMWSVANLKGMLAEWLRVGKHAR